MTIHEPPARETRRHNLNHAVRTGQYTGDVHDLCKTVDLRPRQHLSDLDWTEVRPRELGSGDWRDTGGGLYE